MADLNRIDLYFDRFDESFDQIVPNMVAETATEFFQERFVVQEWNGIPWAPLSEKYAAKKTVGRGRILTSTGALRNSIRPSSISPQRITISAGNARVPYARVHNEGLRVTGVRNVRSYTNSNFMGKGQSKRIKAHTRNVNYQMPQRQFMGPNKELNQLMRARILAALNARR